MGEAHWIAVDWGTTHLRAWRMRGRSARDRATSDQGMSQLAPQAFEPVLLAMIGGWLDPAGVTQVLCCGMVGSRQGWAEAPYRPVPCTPTGTGMVQIATQDARIAVHLVPGLSQSTPPDVMRGEETQVAGFLSLNPNWDGVICLPGTHSKWVLVSAGEVVSFQTYLTGELFALLSRQSVLHHSVQCAGWDADAFAEAVSDSLSRPEVLAARLFRLRADHLLNGTAADVSRSRLSGLLIGAELAGARAYWLGQQVAVIGANDVARAYVDALAAQGVPATHMKGETATLAGLAHAFDALEMQT